MSVKINDNKFQVIAALAEMYAVLGALWILQVVILKVSMSLVCDDNIPDSIMMNITFLFLLQYANGIDW